MLEMAMFLDISGFDPYLGPKTYVLPQIMTLMLVQHD